ncbi:MAG: SpoIID/LytB domain-containing protein, partial [Oscillospiraceae bacterium]|nr:SpoIID/LytB domain-containing protein [Oscillospiraceae bacterium]
MLHRALLVAAALILALLALPLSGLPSGEEPSAPTPALTMDEPEPDLSPAEEEPAPEPPAPAEEAAETPDAPAAAETLRVLMPDGSVEEMALEDYLWGVVAAEMPAAFEEEALKAQAVAARTYTCYHALHTKENHPDADVCTDYRCCQAWISRAERLEKWPEDKGEEYTAKIADAIEATAGETVV